MPQKMRREAYGKQKRKAAERTRGEGAASVLRGARQRSTQALDPMLSRLVNASSPLLDRKGYKVVLVCEPLVSRLAQQLRPLTMLLWRFLHGIHRCELGAVVLGHKSEPARSVAI